MSEIKQNLEQKKNNKYLIEKQLETLKLFFERKLLTQEQYEFEINENGKQKIEITVCSTLANAMKDRFSAYDGIECAEVKQVTLFRRKYEKL